MSVPIDEPAKSRQNDKLSRRNFGKTILAGAGTLAANTLLGPLNQAEATAETVNEQRKNTKTVPHSTIRIDDSRYERFHACDIAFNLVSRELGEAYNFSLVENHLRYTLSARTCRDVHAKNLVESRDAFALGNAFYGIGGILGLDGINQENRGEINSWTPTGLTRKLILPGPPVNTDKSSLTQQAKAVTRISGADMVGICNLDQRHIYASCQPMDSDLDYERAITRNPPIKKPINFRKDVDVPRENKDGFYIPDTNVNAIVFAVEMPRLMVQTGAQSPITGASLHGYARLGFIMSSLANWCRLQGYWAIPSKNDLGLNVPMAADAGLGEVGRNGMLITPEFGPAIRLAKVLTNMPLHHDKPIEFGIESFCNSCLKCARECPAQAITYGEKAWEGASSSNVKGAYKWYNDGIKCLKEGWIKQGATCGACLASCPFTKGYMWPHEVTKTAIKHLPAVNDIWLTMDDAFGYGFWKERDHNDIFKYGVTTYGLDPVKIRKEFT